MLALTGLFAKWWQYMNNLRCHPWVTAALLISALKVLNIELLLTKQHYALSGFIIIRVPLSPVSPEVDTPVHFSALKELNKCIVENIHHKS
jgi:hypothetical protein